MRNSILAAALAGLFFAGAVSGQPPTNPRTLPVCSLPAAGDIFPLWLAAGGNCQISVSNFTAGTATPLTRTITCTAPLLCAGGTSMTLAADRTISISGFSGTSSGTNTGDQVVPANTTNTTSQWFNAYNSSTGTYTKSQPAFTDVSGTATFTQLPTTAKGWTYTSPNLSLSTLTDKVGIGTASPDSPIEVSLNAAALPAGIAGMMIHTGQAADTNNRFDMDAFGTGVSIGEFRHATGTAASPTADQAAQSLGQWQYRGYDGSAFAAGATINALTDQIWTTSNHGAEFCVSTVANNTTTVRAVACWDNAGHATTQGTAPTVACTGTGTSPSAPTIQAGGTDGKFTIIMNTGTVPSSAGTCTVTFAGAYATNKPVLICTLQDGASAWSNAATLRISTPSLTAPVITWTDATLGVLTNLTGSSSYQISCIALQ
jgi:hypothetical protein